MKCQELNTPEILVAYFTSNDEITLSRALRCFRDLFFSDFKGLSHKKFFSIKKFPKEELEEITEDGFNYGLTEFYFFIRQNGFKQQGATVKSLFFTFCLNQLRALTRTRERHVAKYISGDPDEVFAKDFKVENYNFKAIREEMHEMDREAELFQRALQELGERGANLIKWRKVDRLDNEEIAKRTGLDPNSVNNEVYRAFCRLKKIIDVLKTQN